MQTVDAVLEFWFGDLLNIDSYPKEKSHLWFVKSDQTDNLIQEQFGDLVDEALSGGLTQWEADIRSRLALIILLDQFTRNIYRGKANAFRGDTRAYHLAMDALDQGMDRELKLIERVFLYLPLEHWESMSAQDLSVAAFRRLHKESSDAFRPHAEGFVDYAIRHRDVIVQFGRYPHRNHILGRASTPEELAFLEKPGSSF